MKLTILLFVLSIYCSAFAQKNQQNLADFIDTKIGVIDTRGSNCVIGPQLPYGSINPSPQTKDGDHDGYHPQRPIRGFAQLNVSGTGWGKYGHFLVSPQVGVAFGQEEHESEKSDEVTKAYYYAVNLTRYGIRAEMAPTHSCALYQFTYPKSDSASVVLDATQSLADIVPKLGGKFHQCKVEVNPKKKQIRAMIDFTGGWAGGPYKIYFVAELNKAFTESGVWLDKELKKAIYSLELPKDSKQRMGAFIRFKTNNKEKVSMKVAISFKSFENAELFLKNEIKTWDLPSVKSAGMEAWNKKLSSIKIETSSEDQKKIFYTAMYHVMFQPRERTDDNPKWTSDKPYWDDNFAVWDTWRTSFPLLVLIDPDMVRGNILCFMDRLKNNGKVRDAFVAGNDMDSEQGGNDVDNVIADAYVKGVQGIDWNEVYLFMKNNADNERKGLFTYNNKVDSVYKSNNSKYKTLGWIPECLNSNSNTLEYAYNDYCVAQVAKGIGNNNDYEKYLKRSNDWTNLWNPDLESDGFKGFIDAKKAFGAFLYQDAKHWGKSWINPFYEGSSWTYSYFVPHDINQLITLMGGKETYAQRLEHAMDKKLIDYGNEPAFLALRTFNHVGRPDLTSKWVYWIMEHNFDLTGCTGNDDTGAMSSWYMFSAMGFFPNAGQDIYYLNAPLYPKTEMTLGNGQKLTIIAKNAGGKNIYIKSCKINGEKWNSSIFRHADIANGGIIEMELSEVAGDWGKN